MIKEEGLLKKIKYFLEIYPEKHKKLGLSKSAYLFVSPLGKKDEDVYEILSFCVYLFKARENFLFCHLTDAIFTDIRKIKKLLGERGVESSFDSVFESGESKTPLILNIYCPDHKAIRIVFEVCERRAEGMVFFQLKAKDDLKYIEKKIISEKQGLDPEIYLKKFIDYLDIIIIHYAGHNSLSLEGKERSVVSFFDKIRKDNG